MVRFKRLITPHESDEVIGVGEIHDVMSIAGYHLYNLDFVARYFEVQYFIRADFTKLDKTMTADYDEFLIYGVMPVLPLGDSGFGNVDRKLYE